MKRGEGKCYKRRSSPQGMGGWGEHLDRHDKGGGGKEGDSAERVGGHGGGFKVSFLLYRNWTQFRLRHSEVDAEAAGKK